jgi:hypothetical protein
MGSLPRLKIKDEIRYRKGSTNESMNCRACRKYFPNYPIYGNERAPRCSLIGVGEGRRYNVLPDSTCDRQEMSLGYREYLRSLGSLL